MIKETYLPKNSLYPNPTGKEELWYGYQPRFTKPRSIVIHSTNNGNGDTSFSSEVEFLYKTKKVAADHLVGVEEIVQFLDSSRWYGWHAGAVNDSLYANHNSIGIETHYSPFDKKPFNPRIKENLTYLVKKLMKQFTIPAEHIELHRRVAIPKGRKSDPNWLSDVDFFLWRDSLKDKSKSYTCIVPSAVYEAPSRVAKIALNGSATLPVQHIFTGIDQGNGFIWRVDGLGFVPRECVEETKNV